MTSEEKEKRMQELAPEWDASLNKGSFADYSADSTYYANWICPRGHHFRMSIRTRVEGENCFYCKRLTVPYKESIAYLRPDVAAEWDYSKNKKYRPENMRPTSHKMVWWKCSACGYEFKNHIHVMSRGLHCPNCGHQTIPPKPLTHTLASDYPDVAAEWDYERNGELTPDQVSPRSNRHSYFHCSKGHPSWSAVIASRTGKNPVGCPYCSHRLVVPGETDLASVDPAAISEWDEEKNYPLTPQTVTAHSARKVYWICPKGHSYKASIANHENGRRCPYCSHRKKAFDEADENEE